jgi:hypothetical protein
MGRRLQIVVAVLAIAALAGGALSGCACAMPQSAAASHDCCETAGPAISADQGCCGGAASGDPVVLVVALHAAPAPLADAVPVAAAVSTAAFTTCPPAVTSAPPLILRI